MTGVPVNPEQQYDYLLEGVSLRLGADLAFLCRVDAHTEAVHTLAVYPAPPPAPPPAALVRRLCHVSAPQGETHHVYAGTPDAAPFAGGVVACTPSADGVVVVGALTQNAPSYTEADAEAVAGAGRLAATLLEAAALRATTALYTRLKQACNLLPNTASPQAMIEALRAAWLDGRILAAALLHYGPNNSADASFDYVEVAGTWGRTFGSGYGLGTRVYLNNKALISLLDLLDRDGVLRPTPQVLRYVTQDALLRGLLRARMVEDWAIYALHTEQERVGLFLLATDDPAGFSERELREQRELADILTMAAGLQMFRRELRANTYGRAALLDAVNDGVLIVTPGTNGATVTMINERFREMFNCRDLAGAAKLDQVLARMEIPPSVRGRLEMAWKSIPLRDSQTQRGNFAMVTHHGQPADISWYSAPMVNPEGDEVFARVYIFHDTTPEHAAAQVRTAFLSRMSHELRTPLTAISGFSEFILEATGDDLPDVAREYTEIINESAQQLKNVFTDLIAITRAYAGEVELHLTATDLGMVARAAVTQLGPRLREHQQTATVEVHDTTPAHADPDRIGQILRQLLENASAYAPDGTNIHVVVSQVNDEQALPPHAPPDVMLPGMLVQVIDSGPGIPEGDAAAVFEPFHRGRHALAQQIPGTGLGLTLAHSLIDLHRGKIWVEPATARRPGGRVCFVLPVAR